MTAEQVQELVRTQSGDHLTTTMSTVLSLKQTLVPPQKISIIARTVKAGRVEDKELSVWLVGQERPDDGYRIIMRDDGLQFELASSGFPNDKCLVLVGWYGDLLSAFLSM